MANDDEPQQVGDNKAAAKIDDDEPQLVAGRKPAGKLDILSKEKKKNEKIK